MSPRISAVLCTYNRCEQLRVALESLAAQSLSHDLFEVVVVDNGSSDATQAVLAEFRLKNGDMTCVSVVEPQRGHSRARNTGVRLARADVIAFIDDDARASEHWLKQILAAFETSTPKPWGVGGMVLPIFGAPRPHWLAAKFETDTWGEQPRTLRSGESFSGNNMAFRRHVFERFGGFDERMGMKGNALGLGDDTELFQRIWNMAGEEAVFYYSPEIVMYHLVPPDRLTVEYRLKRSFVEGQALWGPGVSIWRRLAYPCWGVVRLFGGCLLAAWHLIRYASREAWIVERVAPLVRESGRILACLGIRMSPMERRPAADR